jgi:acetoin utilization deacetylase AcuC-like enzyme
VDTVVASFRDDPVRLRAPRYGGSEVADLPATGGVRPDQRILTTVNDRHAIHHVHERGYVEAPVRIAAILRELRRTDLLEEVPPHQFGERPITALHDRAWVSYLRRVCERIGPDRAVYPYVFPVRNAARPPRELEVRAGYYCIDTFTPLNANAYLAARRAVDCALTAAEGVLAGARLAYALVRPPGHHAETRVYGGFCYFNNAAIAAQLLAEHARVAILDVDYHHGNGQQEIFYERGDLLTVSIHGHPNFAYPYFSGFADERGAGDGLGANLNLPLPEDVDGPRYRRALERALERILRFRAEVVVVALGLDTARHDPTGSWGLSAADLQENGFMIGRLGCPVLVVQEGGYRVRSLGTNARRFLTGLWLGAFGRTTDPRAARGR